MAGYGKQVGKLSIKVLPNASKFYNAVRDMVKEAEERYKVNLEVTAEVARAKEELEKLYKEWDGRNVGLEAKVATAKAKEELLALTRPRKVTIVANIKQKSFAAAAGFMERITGTRVAKSVFSEINEQLLNLDKNVGKISRMSLLIAQLSSSLLAASAGAIAAGGDLLKVVNLALVAPAAIGGLAVGMGTLIVALKDTGTQLAELGPAFTDLATVIKGNFWEQARQPILDFVNTYLPQLQAGFAATATALGQQGAAIVTTMQSSFGGGVMERMFGNLVDTIDAVTEGVKPLTQALITLGDVGGAYLPQFGGWLADLADKFNTFVQNGKQSGELNALIESGVQAAQDFGRAIGGASGILKGLYDSSKAAGAGGLTGLADALQGAAQIIQGPEVQQALTTLFRGSGYATSALASGFGDLVKMIGSNADAIAGALGAAGNTLGSFASAVAKALDSPVVRQGLTDLFTGIQEGAKGLEPALGPVGELLGTLGSLVGRLAANFGPLLGTIKTTAAPVLDALLNAIIPLVDVFGGALVTAITALEPMFQALADYINQNQEAVTQTIGVLAVFGTALFGIGKAVGAVKGVVGALGGMAKITSAIDTVRLHGMFAADKVKAIATTTANLAKNAAQWAVVQAKAVAAKAAAAGSWLATQAKAVAQVTANLVKQAAQWVAVQAKAAAAKAAAAGSWIATQAKNIALVTANLVKQGAQWVVVQAKAGAAKAAAGGAWLASQAKAIALTTANLARQGVAWTVTAARMVAFKVAQTAITVATKAATAAQWLMNAAMSANPIGLIIAAIVALVAGLVWFFTQTKLGQAIWAGFMSFLQTAWAALVTVATTVFTALGTFFTNLWTGIKTVAMAVWNGTSAAISAVVNGIKTVIIAIITGIRAGWTAWLNGMKAIASTVWNAIKSAINTVVNGIKTVVTNVVNAIKALWTAWLNANLAVARTVWNAIKTAITSVVNGIKSVVSSVVNAIKSLWTSWLNGLKSVASSVWNGIKSAISNVVNGIRSVISNVVSGIRSIWSSGWSALSSVVSNVGGAIRGAVSGMVSAVSGAIGQVGSTLGRIRSTVTGAISGAASWLVDSGKSIIRGLISGIQSMIGAAGDAIGSVMGKIRNFLPFSPAKEGPFSGKGWTPYSGRALVDGLADGMTDRIDRVRAAANAMTRAAQVGDLSIGTSDDALGFASSGSGSTGDVITVQGNVGYNPQQIADAIALRKRQAALAAGLNRVQVR